MKSLFLKIFLSYWLAQALFIMLAMLVTLAMRPQREFTGFEAQQSKILGEAAQAYLSGGADSVRTYLRNVHDTQRVRAYLFNDQGKELTGRTLPDWAERVDSGQD